jgi:ribonuclease Z
MPEPIKLIFLGTGSGVPTLKRAHPAVLFRRGADNFLFDCGESAQLGLQKAGLSPMKISRIFITHWHADHFAGLLPLLETLDLENRKDSLEIYGPEASKFIRTMCGLSYCGFGFEVKAIDVSVKGITKLIDTEDYEIFSVPTKHSIPSVGYLYKEKPHIKIDMAKARRLGLEQGPVMKKLHEKGSIIVKGRKVSFSDVSEEKPGRVVAYSGDTMVHEPFFRAVANADVLIHDGTFVEPFLKRAHASIRDVGKMAAKYKIKKLIFTHFSRRYTDNSELREVAKKSFKNSVVAEDGMEIIV